MLKCQVLLDSKCELHHMAYKSLYEFFFFGKSRRAAIECTTGRQVT
uniref:Uncharacterized protein n=1 Tax=Arundo donax TaxID=35708 RepID=A0A0A9H7E9_ARUDO